MSNKSLFLNSPKQRHGGYYEEKALTYLKGQGLTLIAQNWLQPKVGELDLVMIQPKTQDQGWDIMLFIEVRKRKATGFGDALMSVTASKQRKLIKTAHYFLQQHQTHAELEYRFDVVAFNETDNNSSLEPVWVQGAFIASAW